MACRSTPFAGVTTAESAGKSSAGGACVRACLLCLCVCALCVVFVLCVSVCLCVFCEELFVCFSVFDLDWRGKKKRKASSKQRREGHKRMGRITFTPRQKKPGWLAAPFEVVSRQDNTGTTRHGEAEANNQRDGALFSPHHTLTHAGWTNKSLFSERKPQSCHEGHPATHGLCLGRDSETNASA